MKRTTLFLALAVLLAFTSCSSRKQSRSEQVSEFRSQLTHEDTTIMLKTCDDAMEALKTKNIDKVLASLCEYNDSTKEVKPLSPETAKRYRSQFTMFPVLSYERKYYSFQLEGCNDVKYEVVFATAEQAGTEEPAKTAYMFNPVKIDGQWVLCVKTADEEIDRTMH